LTSITINARKLRMLMLHIQKNDLRIYL